MAVDDYGTEVLKKAAEEVKPGNKADYFLKVGSSAAPAKFDDIILGYTGANLTKVEYKLDGDVLVTLILTYSGARLDRVQVS